MRIQFYFWFLFVLTGCLPSKKIELSPQPTQFPKDWMGIWKGDLKIYGSGKLRRTVPMSLEISPLNKDTTEWTYHIIYGEDREKGLRPYKMIARLPAKGLYVLDEGDNIRMENYFLDGSLYCWFNVQGQNLLSINTLKQDGTLQYDILSGPEKPISVTGGIVNEKKDTIPSVNTFLVHTVQKATLKKITPKK
jgi:hypothetical protein